MENKETTEAHQDMSQVVGELPFVILPTPARKAGLGWWQPPSSSVENRHNRQTKPPTSLQTGWPAAKLPQNPKSGENRAPGLQE